MRTTRRPAAAPARLSDPSPPLLRLGGVAVDLAEVSAVTVAFNGRLFAAGLAHDSANRAQPDRVANLLERIAGEIRHALC